MNKTILMLVTIAILNLFLVSCVTQTTPTETSQPTQEATQTIAPTPTEEIFALSVNGAKISPEELDNEISRLQKAEESAGITRTIEERKNFVLDELIGTLLLAQDAKQNGFQFTEADFQKKKAELESGLGSAQALEDWIQQTGYTQETFRESFERSLAAAFTRDRLMAEVPKSTQQFHLQIILLYDLPTAELYYNQILGGADFNTLASIIDPVTRGDIGWFPIGYLTDPAIEQAVLQMKVDEVKGIVEGKVGFYILKLLKIESDRPLSPDALLQTQKNAIEDWLTRQKAESEIIIME
ncbi:MAG TPA: SurA N-terminal domain-containing protein [Anaerolineales bacterium]|nr:SurA N-terminal domain-containing protein [Anaerolineales bacterium]